MVDMVKGSLLPRALQRLACATYVHRYTRTHRPQWACTMRPDGTPYAVQFASDEEWLANTFFPVNAGRTAFARRSTFGTSCESHPTWPDNPELRRAMPATACTGV